MMSNYLFAYVVGPLVAWLTVLSLGVIAYLLRLEIREWRRNRRMDAERERLGLCRA